MTKIEEKEIPVGTFNIERFLVPVKNGFGGYQLAFRQYINRRLDQEIVLGGDEVRALHEKIGKFISEFLDRGREEVAVTVEMSSVNNKQGQRYLVIETRRVEEKKRRQILHWCNTWDEVLDAVKQAYAYWDINADPSFDDIVTVIQYEQTLNASKIMEECFVEGDK